MVGVVVVAVVALVSARPLVARIVARRVLAEVPDTPETRRAAAAAGEAFAAALSIGDLARVAARVLKDEVR